MNERIRHACERDYAARLDADGIPWVYQPHLFRFGGEKYTPDFYLPIQDTYVEVIGTRQRWQQIRKVGKLDRFRQHFPSLRFQILDRDGRAWEFNPQGRVRKEKPPHRCKACGTTTLPSRKLRCDVCQREKENAEFWAQVDKDSTEHWLWLGTLRVGAKNRFYGRAWFDRKCISAHQAAWRMRGREITPGNVLVNACGTHTCVNPDHWELVPKHQSMKYRSRTYQRLMKHPPMKTHCPQGHEFSDANTYWYTHPDGHRQRWCRECRNAYYRRRYAARTRRVA